ncbi:mandelate racemase/muconate lactonizing enzyme family protein [Pseudoruegeria sp. SK021]|uniref:mandelate racemase/muconate lactonizing enzyme family protein n=1 Tax=Pseudoruegeria sp. SK021 TaxID=1933035 RepID=UPI000A25FCE1|nr:mandelate racemase/muconate lactonizing enzyme family protein [Pseudoruegeria sp. SK021]OSP54006.1 galactonate dehydratase [Pseudoruegeria sp. SK021]
MSRIEGIETFVIRVGTRNQMLVRVQTEDGVVGWGESGLSSRETAVAAAIDCFSKVLIGQDSRRIGRIWQELYRSQYFEGGRVLTAAQSALDIALHDILGQSLGVPVYQLLGGRHRDHVPSFASAPGATIDDSLAEVQSLIAAGWDCVRVVPSYEESHGVFSPRMSIARTAQTLIALRAEIGPEPVLGIDYHHRLSVAETASFCNMLPPGTLDFLEEPIRCEDPSAYKALRGMTDIPFAVGEEFASKWQAAPYVEQGLTQYMRLDICNIGGFTEAMKIAGWCELHYVDLMPHNPLGPVCTAATAHLAMAVPNLSWVETRQAPTEALGFHCPKLFPGQVDLQGANYIVTEAPGLGIVVDEDAIRAADGADPIECPHLTRADGSVTNW